MNKQTGYGYRLWAVVLAAFMLLPLAALAQKGEGEIREEPPKGISVDEVIKRFAEKEKQFKEARERYTWRQSVRVETMDGDQVTGRYESVVDILFDDKGRRQEQVVFAPQSTLTEISMTKEDLDDIEKRLPFVLTSDDVNQYNIKYVGQQRQDELNTYVFDVSPKTIEKGQRYFDGRIWVDDTDYQIVKTYGKSVPDLVNGKPVEPGKKSKNGQENFFPKFTTYREQIDGKYWFPTYTKVDDTLHFTNNDVHIRQVVKYTNYKRFGATSKITFEGQDISTKPDENKPDQNQKPPQR